MNEWWDGLSLLLKVLYCIAFPSTLILLVQTLLSMFGFHDGGSGHDFSDTSGLDLDVDTNISGHGDVGYAGLSERLPDRSHRLCVFRQLTS